MSKTIRGGKGPGYEYWTARPHNKNGATPGGLRKQRTKRTERQQGKMEARKGVEE